MTRCGSWLCVGAVFQGLERWRAWSALAKPQTAASLAVDLFYLKLQIFTKAQTSNALYALLAYVCLVNS